MTEAIASFKRALELEPNNAMCLSRLSSALGFAGRPEDSLETNARARRGSPRDPDKWNTSLSRVVALFAAQRFEEALEEAKNVIRLQPNHYGSYSFEAASAGLLNRSEDARSAADGLLKLMPRFSIAATIRNPMFERPEDAARIIEGLRLAGIPEG